MKNNKEKYYHPIALIVVINIFSYFYNPGFIQIMGGDARLYLAIANDFFSINSKDSPPFFPFMIFIGQQIPFLSWQEFIILLNWIIHLMMGLILWNLFSYLNIRKIVRWLTILTILFSPRILYYKYDLSPEMLFSFLILILFYFIGKKYLIHTENKTGLINAIILGILSSLCALTKPIWLLGGILISVFLGLYFKNKPKYAIKIFITVLIASTILLLNWQLFLYAKFDQKNISTVQTRNLNLLSIRSGYFNDAQHTDLHRLILKNESLYSLTQNMKWENFDKFTKIKDSLNHYGDEELRNDNQFYQKAILNNFFSYLSTQSSRIPAFINAKYLNLLNWDNWPDSFEKLYLRYYKFIFLYVIPAFFLFGFIYTIWNKDPFSLLGLIFILYYTIVCVFLSYQDTAFNRLRVGIDPVLMSFFVICFRRLKWIEISNDNLNN